MRHEAPLQNQRKSHGNIFVFKGLHKDFLKFSRRNADKSYNINGGLDICMSKLAILIIILSISFISSGKPLCKLDSNSQDEESCISKCFTETGVNWSLPKEEDKAVAEEFKKGLVSENDPKKTLSLTASKRSLGDLDAKCNLFMGSDNLKNGAAHYVKNECSNEDEKCLKPYKELAVSCRALGHGHEGGFRDSDAVVFFPLGGLSNMSPQIAPQTGAKYEQYTNDKKNNSPRGPGCHGGGYAYDYEACTSYVSAFSGFSMAEKLFIAKQDNSIRSYNASLAAGVRNSQKLNAAIEAKKLELENAINAYKKRRGFYIAQAALVNVPWLAWPKAKNLHKKEESCQGKESCCYFLAMKHQDELLPNKVTRMQFTGFTAEFAMGMIKLEGHIKKLEEELAKLGNYKRKENEKIAGFDEILMTYCQSPQGRRDRERCSNIQAGDGENQYSAHDGNTLGYDWTGGDASVSSGQAGIDPVASFSKVGSDSNQEALPEGLLDFNQKTDGSGFVDNPGAGSFKRGSGGGGGSGGGAGGPGGGGGATLSQKQDDIKKELSKLTKMETGGSYSSGKKGGRGSSSGGARRRSPRRRNVKTRNIGDAFKNMFGGRNVKKSPVGPKNMALFDMISNRYGKAKTSGRIK